MPNDVTPTARPSAILDDPRLAAFLPLLYVAWADGDLSPEEIRSICARVSTTEGIDSGCRDHLGGWLDPDNPPSASDLRALLTAIRRGAGELSREKRRALTRLGLELARVDGHDVPPSEIQAFQEIEQALGVAGAEVSRSLLTPVRPAPEARPAEAPFEVPAMTRLLDGERHALEPLLDLFALERIERDRGRFLEHGYLEPAKAKAIRKLVDRLCR